MDDKKLQLVRDYLKGTFPGKSIEEQYDFDRGAQTFKVQNKPRSLLLKVSEEFIADNDGGTITKRLQEWQIAELLREHGDLGILISDPIPMLFNR